MENFLTGSAAHRRKVSDVNKVTTTTASGALAVTASGHHRLNGSSLAMTVAAPVTVGVELKIDNVAASAATVTVTSPDADATANVFTLAAASATVRASMVLKAIDISATSTPSLVWSSGPLGAGCTVA